MHRSSRPQAESRSGQRFFITAIHNQTWYFPRSFLFPPVLHPLPRLRKSVDDSKANGIGLKALATPDVKPKFGEANDFFSPLSTANTGMPSQSFLLSIAFENL